MFTVEPSDGKRLVILCPLSWTTMAIAAQTQHYADAVLVYFVNNNIQLDIHSAVGLNRAADDLAFTGIGFSIRR